MMNAIPYLPAAMTTLITLSLSAVLVLAATHWVLNP